MLTRREFIETSAAGMVAARLSPFEAVAPSNIPPVPLSKSASLDDIHDLLQKHCAPDNLIGCAINLSFLEKTLNRQLQAARPDFVTHKYPTALPEINAGLDLEPATLQLRVSAAEITLTGFNPIIVLSEPSGAQRPYNQIRIEFDPVALKLDPSPSDRDSLSLGLAAIPSFRSIAGSPDTAVVNANGMTISQYQAREAAILASTAPAEILDSFIASIPLPSVLTSMETFGIGIPRRFVAEAGFWVITGVPVTKGSPSNCPPPGVVFERDTTPPTLTETTANQNGVHIGRSVTARFVEPQHPGNPDDTAVAYYYPKETTFEALTESTLKPALGASDSGQAFLFKWFYHLSAILRQLTVSFIPPERRIDIDAPFDIGGGAGVSLKVGCVYVPLASSQVFGEFNPSLLTIVFGIATTPEGPVVTSACSYNAKADISFHNPPLVDLLLDIFMGSIGNRLIERELGRRAQMLSRRLVSLNQLLPSASFQRWRAMQNLRTDSVLIALEEDRG